MGAAVAARVIVPGFTADKPADLSDRRVQEQLSPAAIRAFVRLLKAWRLKEEHGKQLLGGISAGKFYDIKRVATKRLDQDQLTRISLLVGIFKSLRIIFPEPLADAWPTRENDNELFKGETPVSYMIYGGIPALVMVRQLLDSRRGGQ